MESNKDKNSEKHKLQPVSFLKPNECNRWLVILFLALLFLTPAFSQSTAPSLQRYQYMHKQMGTLFRIVVYAPDSLLARQASSAAFLRIDQLNDKLSDYLEDSELNKLSATAGTGQKIPVSKDLWNVLSIATEAARQSKGAFDITVGPYVKLWRRSRRQGELPSSEALAKARKAVGYQHLKLYSSMQAVELRVPGMQLDLGAIGKGYAVDEALKVLQQQGIASAMVDGGGNIAVSAPPSGQEGWHIEIGSLPEKRAAMPHIEQLSLSHAGMASSGDVYQYVEIEGKRYSHIVHPKTGLGLTHQTMATVLAPDGTTADLLSTTISVLGLQKGKKLLKSYKASACYIQYPDGRVETWKAK